MGFQHTNLGGCIQSIQIFILLITDKHHSWHTLRAYFVPGTTLSGVCACVCVCVQFSHSVVSDSLQPHESQHARPPCPSPTPGVHSDSVSIESVMPSSHLILCHPLLLLPPTPPSIRVWSQFISSFKLLLRRVLVFSSFYR